MSIPIQCKNGHSFKVKNSLAGRKVLCPKCKVKIDIPRDEPDDYGFSGMDFSDEKNDLPVEQSVRKNTQKKEPQKKNTKAVSGKKEKEISNRSLFLGSAGITLFLTLLIGSWILFGRSSTDEKSIQNNATEIKM